MLLLAVSLLFTDPLPLDMPRAEGYLVRERGVCRLEDRFNKLDLWVSQSVAGRWMDVDGRVFMLSHLDVLPPEGDAARSVATRKAYVAGRVRIDPRDKQAVRTAVAALSPVEVPEKPDGRAVSTVYEPEPDELLKRVMPDFLAGRLYSAVCDSYASEVASRRNAMDSATKNADAMISDLRLKYNRARQGAITQEITEIVAGS